MGDSSSYRTIKPVLRIGYRGLIKGDTLRVCRRQVSGADRLVMGPYPEPVWVVLNRISARF